MTEGNRNRQGSILRPLKNLRFLGRPPVTLPIKPRPAAERYRGFHLNDWDTCIGCGTCSQICDNRAIRMVNIPDLPSDPVKGIKPRRPAIDYGRCCWCGLCVDICPSGSLSLSREYIHISANLNSFFILPDEKGMHGLDFPPGWAKDEHSDLLDLQRHPPEQLPLSARADNFDEIVAGFDSQTALLEASRCIQCGMCHEACPTHMHAPEYIRALWSGDAEEAVRQIYRTNPLASVCGRICTHRCESACSIGRRGEPISIRWLKRYAMDSVAPQRIRQIVQETAITPNDEYRVAIIGSGPAGLTAAFDLARAGYGVTVFEAMPQPGGMPRYGIPEYRLPYAGLDSDIDVIRSLGVEIRCDTRVGEDVGMDILRLEFQAIVIATGLWLGRSTRIPGSEHERVVPAVELLRNISLGSDFEVPQHAVVIGGGNVAMDAARSLVRVQRQQGIAPDVTVVALENRQQMLADPEEVREAEEEGIVICPGRGPRECRIEDGCLRGLETVACLSVFDDTGRFHPRYDDSDQRLHTADMIVEAIGQGSDLVFLGEVRTEELEWERGRLQVDAAGRTSLPWLWAAGDIVEGPDVIHAIAAGHRVAVSIKDYLEQMQEQRDTEA